MPWISGALFLICLLLILSFREYIKKRHRHDSILVEVKDLHYQPARVKLKARKANQIVFLRTDSNLCSEYLLFPELGLSIRLKLNKQVSVNFSAYPPGEYEFYSAMNVYSGKLTIV
ncbi:cupredoxin-like protein [Alteromonas sp. 76-1]|jgi:plastocyanin domain-containing protein|uniref:cupredoxin domain-containing protein n=1 Tax=Alteromonas TaxID=226 RepID=UPI000689BBB2|nr:cupredoxin-like protein [Alteromonas sp. 76-1]